MWYFSPVLFPFGLTWFSTEASDLNPFVEQFRALGSSNYFLNLSSDVITSWKDLGLLRVEAIQSLIQYIFGWAVSPIFGPVGALNLYLLIGMTSSGVVTYILAKKLHASTSVAVLAGLTVQCLPWLRQNLLFGTACVFISVPLGLVLLLHQTSMRSVSTKDLIRIGSYMIFTGLFYSYWFFFGQFIIIIWIIASTNDIKKLFAGFNSTKQSLVALVVGLLTVAYIITFRELLKHTQSEFGTPFGVYPVEQVMTNINTLRGLISPDAFHLVKPSTNWTEAGDEQNYLGVFVAVFALARLVRIARVRTMVLERRITLVAIACFALAMGRINFANLDIPSLREYMRFLMPGIRQFSRLGLIAQALFVVLAWKEIGDRVKVLKSPVLKNIVVVTLGLLVLVDLNPASRRFVYEPRLSYQQINSALSKSRNHLLLVSQNSEPAIGLFESSIVRDQPNLYSSLAEGLNGFSKILAERKISHILANVDDGGRSYMTAFIQDSIRFNLELPTSDFQPIGEDVRIQEREDFGGPIVRDHLVRLVKIQNSTPTKSFGDFPQLAQFTSNPPLEVVDPNMNRALNRIDWSTNNEVSFRAESLPGFGSNSRSSRFFMRLQLTAPELQEEYGMNLVIQDVNGTQKIQISTIPRWIEIEFDQVNEARIVAESECVRTKSSDGRWGVLEGKNVCFGIVDFIVYSIR